MERWQVFEAEAAAEREMSSSLREKLDEIKFDQLGVGADRFRRRVQEQCDMVQLCEARDDYRVHEASKTCKLLEVAILYYVPDTLILVGCSTI